MTAALSIVRRFCSCDLERLCRCGLPQTLSGWTVGKLSRLRQVMQTHGSLPTAAAEVAETPQRANIALEALLGRTPTQALAALEARASRERYEAEKAAFAQALTTPAVIEALSHLRAAP